ncbi:type I-A CRISPR-associated protein Cas8a2/Csx9 [Infirmifilum lucidum]|uniref:Type I-A CRISPR-associated protein Cas8a2/Csx9 n=1 Tax=Infirmifilum lucidum TaxID=2776706 RepID=A0A7L9FIH2_9CREN|nr:type I-A CRISPR-associated protein Cas8a2/Csx9 [Infirmifilum lucidum]QOJ78823.1 type I-A CRISPR-associated protein Cas8a2/Csx9 [Infirmifilum lucidum]
MTVSLTTGLFSELVSQGLAYLYVYSLYGVPLDDPSVDQRVADIFEYVVKELERDKEYLASSEVAGHFKSHYFAGDRGVLLRWYGGGEQPAQHTELMLYVMKGTAGLLRQGQVSFAKSMQAVSGLSYGVPFKGLMAIPPAIIKQPEFYEKQTLFLKPTSGPDADIEVDPVWFAVLALGFMLGFGGYYDGAYHVFTKPGLPPTLEGVSAVPLDKLKDIVDSLSTLTAASRRERPTTVSEEIFALQLSIAVAKSERALPREVFPFCLYEIEYIANTYTLTRSVFVNIEPLVTYFEKYYEVLRKEVTGLSKEEALKPLKAVVGLAARELSERFKQRASREAGEPLAYLFVKDFYRAVMSGNARLLEESLLRFLRELDVALHAREVPREYRDDLQRFRGERNVKAMVEAVLR